MATRNLVRGAAVLVLLLVVAGCSNDDADSSAQPATVAIAEVGVEVDVPSRLADLTYAMGESEEGQPAVYFSTAELAKVGGPTCAAGATAAVSPFPLGQIVLSEETPEHVREEAKENPEENLGRFVKRVGEHYVYYVPPPAESCTAGSRDATRLQRELTAELRLALSTLRLG